LVGTEHDQEVTQDLEATTAEKVDQMRENLEINLAVSHGGGTLAVKEDARKIKGRSLCVKVALIQDRLALSVGVIIETRKVPRGKENVNEPHRQLKNLKRKSIALVVKKKRLGRRQKKFTHRAKIYWSVLILAVRPKSVHLDQEVVMENNL
jgi:hypothetical protein